VGAGAPGTGEDGALGELLGKTPESKKVTLPVAVAVVVAVAGRTLAVSVKPWPRAALGADEVSVVLVVTSAKTLWLIALALLAA
jgi:hypothetical protein